MPAVRQSPTSRGIHDGMQLRICSAVVDWLLRKLPALCRIHRFEFAITEILVAAASIHFFRLDLLVD